MLLSVTEGLELVELRYEKIMSSLQRNGNFKLESGRDCASAQTVVINLVVTLVRITNPGLAVVARRSRVSKKTPMLVRSQPEISPFSRSNSSVSAFSD
jgi:hypothetical protein